MVRIGGVDGLAEAVDELYRLPPADFTARRDELSKEARADGNKALAAAVTKLRRPTVSAWAVNLLVREEPDLVEQLLALGGLLREAQSGLDGQALKDLDRQRRGVVGALARRAATLAGEQGQRLDAELSRQVERSLGAALADPDAASAAVASGQLTKPLDNVGFGVEVTPDAVAVPGLVLVGSSRRRAASTKPRAEGSGEKSEVREPESLDDARNRRRQAREEKAREQARKDEERREKERQARAQKARAALERAQTREREAAVAARRAAAELDELRATLDDLSTQRDELAARLADAEQQVAEATDRVTEQEQRQTASDATLAEATRQLQRSEQAADDAEG